MSELARAGRARRTGSRTQGTAADEPAVPDMVTMCARFRARMLALALALAACICHVHGGLQMTVEAATQLLQFEVQEAATFYNTTFSFAALSDNADPWLVRVVGTAAHDKGRVGLRSKFPSVSCAC